MTDVSEILDYYVNLLIIQYRDMPKAQAMIRLLVEQILASGLIFDVRDAFNLDTAVGVQLDTIGLYVGIDRFYSGQVLDGYFAFVSDDETSVPGDILGFSIYSDPDTPGKVLQYSDVLSLNFSLNDDDFRFLIKLKIIQNNSNHSHKEIDDSIYRFFGNTVVPDSMGNMNMNYFVTPNQSAIFQIAIQKSLLPRPMGVRIGYLIEQDEDFFALLSDDEAGVPTGVTGFSTYADYDTKNGDTLSDANLMRVL